VSARSIILISYWSRAVLMPPGKVTLAIREAKK
jgi:hypothetical protein